MWWGWWLPRRIPIPVLQIRSRVFGSVSAPPLVDRLPHRCLSYGDLIPNCVQGTLWQWIGVVSDHPIVEKHLPIAAEVAGEQERTVSLLFVHVVCCKFSDIGLLELHCVVRYAAWVAEIWVLHAHILLLHVCAVVAALKERPQTSVEVTLIVPYCNQNASSCQLKTLQQQ